MRVAAARDLHLTDITADGLLIREAKFHKSRLLPLHGTTRAALDRYRVARCRYAGADPHLFVTRRGRKLSHTVVSETFHQVLTAAGGPREPGRRRPRLMDLRHTFAVRALERCPETRDAIGRHTLALTTYMGHACVSSTCWYLESTPQLMTDIARTCETFMSGGGS
jgi:integrase/recombinase XerD